MITPSYSLTATERVLPKLALDFTTATLDPRITFTRTGNTATVTNSSGVIVGVNADIPRFDFDPVTLVCRGLLIEESRTNVLLNSLIDGSTLGTQSVVVTAAARTLSFYGTGQIVLSGAASATVTGTGAYPARTTLTFTPSAGVLTLTVTGTVQFAQLELGSFATSYIPTAASQVTRTADVATMTGTNFSSWFNVSAGTMYYEWVIPNATVACNIFSVSDGTGNNRYQHYSEASSILVRTSASGASANNTIGTSAANAVTKVTFGYGSGTTSASDNGSSVTTTTQSLPSTLTTAYLGASATGAVGQSVTLRKINYYPLRLTNAEVQAFSK
jgi:hypothetical protein